MAGDIVNDAVIFDCCLGVAADLDTTAHHAIAGRIIFPGIAICNGEAPDGGISVGSGNGHDRPLVISVNNSAVGSFLTNEVDRLIRNVNDLLVGTLLYVEIITIAYLIQTMLDVMMNLENYSVMTYRRLIIGIPVII